MDWVDILLMDWVTVSGDPSNTRPGEGNFLSVQTFFLTFYINPYDFIFRMGLLRLLALVSYFYVVNVYFGCYICALALGHSETTSRLWSGNGCVHLDPPDPALAG